MRLCSIASGSSGNCIYVGSDRTHLLVDTGISRKRIDEGLHTLGIKGEELAGILITHEHSDHIQGTGRVQPEVRHPGVRHERDPAGHYGVPEPWQDAGGAASGDPHGHGV